MSNINNAAGIVLINTRTRPGTLILPSTVQVVGRTITIKDSVGGCGTSTCYISSIYPDLFEDGTNQKAITTPFGVYKLTASEGIWYTLNTTQETLFTASTIVTQQINSGNISTSSLYTSSIGFSTATGYQLYTSTSVAYWGPFAIGAGTDIAQPQIFFSQAPVILSKGSLLFPGTTAGNITTPNFSGIQLGTGDFTVECFTYQTTGSSYPRLFTMGAYPSATFGVSIEGGSFYFWFNGGRSYGTTSLFNAWNHVAITRSSSQVKVFINGSQLGTTVTNAYNHTDSSNVFRIGGENTVNTGYNGYITNFRLVKGTSIYNSNFTRPSAALTAVSGTQLLLLTEASASYLTDSSPNANVFTNNGGVTWVSNSPF